jgi:hypothetical protein
LFDLCQPSVATLLIEAETWACLPDSG